MQKRNLKDASRIQIFPSNSNEQVASLCHEHNDPGRRVVKGRVGVDQANGVHQGTQLGNYVWKITWLNALKTKIKFWIFSNICWQTHCNLRGVVANFQFLRFIKKSLNQNYISTCKCIVSSRENSAHFYIWILCWKGICFIELQDCQMAKF